MTTTTQYDIRQVVPIVSFKVRYSDGNIDDNTIVFLPWRSEVLEIDMRIVTCLNNNIFSDINPQHKDPKISVFQDSTNGDLIFNPYPLKRKHNSYISSGDRFGLIVRDMYTQEIISVNSHIDLFDYLSDILSSRKKIEDELINNDKNIADDLGAISALGNLYADLVSKYEKMTGKKVIYSKDGLGFKVESK